MKTLLRSVLVIDPTDNQDMILENHRHLDSSNLTFSDAEDTAIWTFVSDFIQQHHHPPTMSTVESHFARTGETTTVDRLHMLKGVRIKTRGDFLQHLEIKAEDRRKMMVGHILQEAAEIVTKGIQKPGAKKGEKIFLQGPQDAMRYLMDEAHAIVTPTSGARLSGDVVHDGEDFIQHYDRVKNDPLAGVGQFVGIKQMDDSLGGAKKFELWTHAAFTGGLKCYAHCTIIYDAITGIPRTVKDIFKSQVLPAVHSLDETTGKIVTATADICQESGRRKILKITTEKGRSIRVTGNHPIYTPAGWTAASRLKVGNWVGTPKHLPNNIVSRFTDAEVCIIGYLLGDGSIHNAIVFTNSNPAILAHYIECVESVGCAQRLEDFHCSGKHYSIVHKKSSKDSYDIKLSIAQGKNSVGTSPIRMLLERLGLWGSKAQTKHIPAELWAITDAQAWMLISALWSTDGRVSMEAARKNRKNRAKCWFGSTSQQLCLDIQALLQRLGVPTTVVKVNQKYKGEPYDAWTVHVLTPDGLTRFLTNTKIIGKEAEAQAALESVGEHDGDWVPTALFANMKDDVRTRSKSGGWLYVRHLRKREKVQRDTFCRLAHASGDESLIRMAESDVRWERIVSIVPDGVEMTYDLSVPGPRNFVANGLITHNSSLMLNWAYTQAIYYGHSSLIFSLEMPYVQVRNLLYAMHSSHEKFEGVHAPLEYQRLKEGRLSVSEERFLKDYVVPDFNNTDHHGSIHVEVADPNKSEFTVMDMRMKAETLYNKNPFKLLFVDHALLLAPKRWVSSTTDRLNEVIRDCKKMAMSFNKGTGMAVVLLFQISREGYKAARKARGLDRVPSERESKSGKTHTPSDYVYDLDHLSYANEAERSSDVVTATWIDHKLSADGEILIQCLKARDVQPFKPFKASIFWPCRRFRTLEDPTLEDLNQASVELDVENL